MSDTILITLPRSEDNDINARIIERNGKVFLSAYFFREKVPMTRGKRGELKMVKEKVAVLMSTYNGGVLLNMFVSKLIVL